MSNLRHKGQITIKGQMFDWQCHSKQCYTLYLKLRPQKNHL